MENQAIRSARVAYMAANTKEAATPGQRELLANLAKLGLVSGGVGATYGVARGLGRMLHTPQLALGSGSNVPTQLSVIDPARLQAPEEDDELQQPTKPAYKFAGATDYPSPIPGEGIAGMLPEPDNANVLTGSSIPLTAAATILPAVGAYKGIRGLFNKFRQSEQAADLDAAKKEYEASLAKQYQSVALGKTAEAKEITDGIDALFGKTAETWLDKIMSAPPLSWIGLDPKNLYGSAAAAGTNGALGNNASEGWNSLKGLGTAAMLGTGAAAGKYMYDRSLKTNPEAVMQEALKRRSRQRRGVPNVLTPQLMNEDE